MAVPNAFAVAMSQSITFHRNFLERKVMIHWKLTLDSREVATLRLAGELGGFIADQANCILPVDEYLAEVVQEGDLVEEGLGKRAT